MHTPSHSHFDQIWSNLIKFVSLQTEPIWFKRSFYFLMFLGCGKASTSGALETPEKTVDVARPKISQRRPAEFAPKQAAESSLLQKPGPKKARKAAKQTEQPDSKEDDLLHVPAADELSDQDVFFWCGMVDENQSNCSDLNVSQRIVARGFLSMYLNDPQCISICLLGNIYIATSAEVTPNGSKW